MLVSFIYFFIKRVNITDLAKVFLNFLIKSLNNVSLRAAK